MSARAPTEPPLHRATPRAQEAHPSPWMNPAFEAGLVSVIIPTHNRAHLVVEAIDSVAHQSYRPIEIIVVDDDSHDDTQHHVLRCLATPDQGVCGHYLWQAKAGAQAARNRGLMQSRGEFIQFLDSDDLILPDKLDVQVSCLRRQEDIDFAYGLAAVVDRTGRVVDTIGTRLDERPGRARISVHAWDTNSPLFRRRVCCAAGPWDIELWGCQEYEYAARVKARGFRGLFLDRILVHARQHDVPTISGQRSERYAAAMEHAAEKIVSMLEHKRRAFAAERNHIGRNLVATALRYARSGQATSSRRCLQRAYELSSGPQRLAVHLLCFAARELGPRTALEGVRRFVRLAGRVRGAHGSHTMREGYRCRQR